MAEVTSLAALMKSNARLKKHADKAKTATPQFKDYTGEEGEVIALFQGLRVHVKDGVTYVVLDFKVHGEASHQPEQNGARCSLMTNLSDDSERGQTMESQLERVFIDLQRMGIDTAELDLGSIDKAVVSSVGKTFKMRAVRGKKDKTKFYFNLVGPSSVEGDDTPADDSSPETDDAGDEWQEEVEAAEETPAEDSADDYNPSDWIGFEVEYKPAKSPKALTFKVVEADDDAGTVVLERNGKTVKAKYADLILP